jgi:hypothetical protein
MTEWERRLKFGANRLLGEVGSDVSEVEDAGGDEGVDDS